MRRAHGIATTTKNRGHRQSTIRTCFCARHNTSSTVTLKNAARSEMHQSAMMEKKIFCPSLRAAWSPNPIPVENIAWSGKGGKRRRERGEGT